MDVQLFESLSGMTLVFKTFRNPDFDYRLAGHAKTGGFSIQRLNHPDGEVDIDSLLLSSGTSRPGIVEILRNVFTVVEFLVKLLSFHILLPPVSGPGEQK